MDLAEKLVKKFLTKHCDAHCRTTGQPCKNKPMRNPQTGHKIRCRMHGGLSTGPKTKEGKLRIAEGRKNSRHHTSPDRWLFSIFPNRAYFLLRMKNNKQAYLRRTLEDCSIKL